MKRLLVLTTLLLGAALAARAQCAGCTTVAGTIYTANGNLYNGTLLISWPIPFASADGHYNLIGPPISIALSGGALSIPLEPNDTASPAGTYYTIRSAVSGLVSLTCRVPTSGSSVSLASVCTAALPVASSSSLVESLATRSGSLNFINLGDGGCVDQTFSFPGLLTTSQLEGGFPSGLATGLIAVMFPSAANTADVRLCNFSGRPVTTGSLIYDAIATSYTLAASSALTFGSIPDGGCSPTPQPISIGGAVPGDMVIPTYPASLPSGTIPYMTVTTPNVVSVTLCNWSGTYLTSYTATFGAALGR